MYPFLCSLFKKKLNHTFRTKTKMTTELQHEHRLNECGKKEEKITIQSD